MTITQTEISNLEASINDKLAVFKAAFIMTVHFSVDRLNDIRNNPPITIAELDDIFNKVIAHHMLAILVLNDSDTFNIRCLNSHINMPCAVKKDSRSNASITHKNIVITVMRKQNFFSKDPIEFTV